MSDTPDFDALKEALERGPAPSAELRQRARVLAAFEARGRRTVRPWVLAAAGVAVMGAIGVALRPARPPLTFADAQPVPLGAPLVVPEAATPLVLAFADKSQVTIAPGSTAQVDVADASRVEVRVSEGQVDAHVQKGTGRTWRYLAGDYAVRVTGTRLSVRWTPRARGLDVAVSEGSVEVTGPGIAVPVAVRAGQRWRAAAGAPSKAPEESAADARFAPSGGSGDATRTGALEVQGTDQLGSLNEMRNSPPFSPSRVEDLDSTDRNPESGGPSTSLGLNGVAPSINSLALNETGRKAASATSPEPPPDQLGLDLTSPGTATSAAGSPRPDRPGDGMRPDELGLDLSGGGSGDPARRSPRSLPARSPEREASPDASTWRALLAGGRAKEGLAAAASAGALAHLESLSTADALLIADAARLTHDVELARRALATVADRSSAEAAEGAFLLGRLEAEQHHPEAAANAFRASIERAPNGEWAEQARGRLLETLLETKDDEAISSAAIDYLVHHPDGAWARTARATLDARGHQAP